MKEFFRNLIFRFGTFLLAPALDSQKENQSRLEQQIQLLLSLRYKDSLTGNLLPRFDETGFRSHSESDEDGKLLFIFSLIGTLNKKIVDIGAAGLAGSNSANLILNHGWTGLLIEANQRITDPVKSFYSRCPDTRNFPPIVVNASITRENINDVITRNDYGGELDLLLIDIDGNDYWIWEAIDSINPRVILLEYQAIWGPERSVTVPYKPAFRAEYYDKFAIYSGASLAAFVKLGQKRGYRLVGCNRYGYNAFFVRNDLGTDTLPEVHPAECFKHPFAQWAVRDLLPKVADREWVEV